MSFISAEPLPGIRHHFAVLYGASSSFLQRIEPRPTTRITRCAQYDFTADDTIDLHHPIAAAVDQKIPKAGLQAPLGQRWQNWHQRTELAFWLASQAGLAQQLSRAERRKGSSPTLRPTAPAASHRIDEPISDRQLKRLHRGLCERKAKANIGGFLTLADCHANDASRWCSLARRGVLPPIETFQTISYALDIIDAALAASAKKQAAAKQAAWKQHFKNWSDESWQPAKTLLQPPSSSCHLLAAVIADECDAKWSAAPGEGDLCASRWNSFSTPMGLHYTERRNNNTLGYHEGHFNGMTIPGKSFWHGCMLTTKGSGGPDGWTAKEIRALARHMPYFNDELYVLWCQTTVAPTIAQQDIDQIWSNRIVALPKGDTFRGLGIFSVLARPWHRALNHFLPGPAPDQMARAKSSVPVAIARWFSLNLKAGAEVDQSAAYDRVHHAVARMALNKLGTPDHVTDTLCRAWSAARTVWHLGELSRPIRPTRSVPQGDPCAGATYQCTTSPWTNCVESVVPSVTGLSWVDDRSLGSKQSDVNDAMNDVHAALVVNGQFDTSIGMAENVSKRQLWKAGQNTVVEHLGVRTDYSQPALPITPKDGWTKFHYLVNKLAQVPGPRETRITITRSFIMPCCTWAAPWFTEPPNVAKQIMGNILQTGCTWWCYGRFFAENIDLHPVYAVAVRGMSALRSCVSYRSSQLHYVMQRHASVLNFDVQLQNGKVWVRPNQLADCRVVQYARESCSVGARPDGFFDAHSSQAMHGFRLAARCAVVLEMQSNKYQRRDSDGLERIDMHAQSHFKWKAFIKTLSSDQKSKLGIIRCGAASTPTRRFRGDIACCHCKAMMPSARHFFESCPGPDNKLLHYRTLLSRQHSIDASWWLSQPIVTSKSAWITLDAAGCLARRVELQIAAAKMALQVTTCISSDDYVLDLDLELFPDE